MNFQQLMEQSYLTVAKQSETKAQFEAGAASVAYDKAQVELKTAELWNRRAQQACRPSVSLGATIHKEDRGGQAVYIATYQGLAIEGESPEIAFQNFDREWSQGDEL